MIRIRINLSPGRYCYIVTDIYVSLSCIQVDIHTQVAVISKGNLSVTYSDKTAVPDFEVMAYGYSFSKEFPSACFPA